MVDGRREMDRTQMTSDENVCVYVCVCIETEYENRE